MLALPVSAGPKIMVVEDTTGDVGFGVDYKESEISKVWADNTPIVQAGYFDMISTWLSQKGKKYTFGMGLLADLPKEGVALPDGIHLAEWAVWIDPSPYHVTLNPVASLFLIALRYDGSSYSSFILDYGTMVATPVEPSIVGSTFQLEFSASSIGNLAFEWWSPMVRAWWGQLGSSGYWFVDAVDFGTVDGQVYYDLPWPPA